MMFHYYWLMGLWGLLTTLFFLGGVALLGIWAIRTYRPGFGPAGAPAAPPAGRDPAMELLRHRFAAGEIDQKEFEARRRLLEGDPRP